MIEERDFFLHIQAQTLYTFIFALGS